ncbi:cytochrome P450 [Chromohalobacter israelensis]|uniref:cytochrome P450 n=1 Tax=Chromohalobacter israelensis TaxID=141390 RepID=UPI000FFF3FE9|nr:cytochrome P450 [Chromohalobacter salexigens]RXE47040.1 hypothetical protein B4O83_03115 [Chromohalobacter salexigens]
MNHYQEAPQASQESTLAILREGYRYIGSQCDRLETDVFRSRLMLKNTLFIRGESSARLFYDKERLTRSQAAPKRLQKTLFGVGGVQGLEGESHRERKALFLSFMSQERITRLVHLVEETWQKRMPYWQAQPSVVLQDEFHWILCRAACDWCGIAVSDENIPGLAHNLALMIEGGGKVGPKHWKARRARRLTEEALVQLIDEYRHQHERLDPSLPLPAFATLRDHKGLRLPSRIVAVELLNLIRPIMAIARYMVFTALAIHENPDCAEKLRGEDNHVFRHYFIEEVRRFYPFFPFLIARVRHDFVWHGYKFHKGWQVILDLYGTNHDAKRWKNPDQFLPDRFQQESNDYHRFAMVPQGGGSYEYHRCPGEWITLSLLEMTIQVLTRKITYNVPPQDMSVNLTTIPTQPYSGFIIDSPSQLDSIT